MILNSKPRFDEKMAELVALKKVEEDYIEKENIFFFKRINLAFKLEEPNILKVFSLPIGPIDNILSYREVDIFSH